MTPAAVKEARQSLGLTVEELRHILGTDRRTINRWEDGSRAINPTAAQVMRWLVEGRITLDQITKGETHAD